MTPSNYDARVAAYDVGSLASLFRWAWWGHRLIYLDAGYTFFVFAAAATYYSSVLDVKNPLLTRHGLVGIYLGLLAGYSLYKTTRNHFSDFPLYIVYWALAPLGVLLLPDPVSGRVVLSSPCLSSASTAACSGAVLGVTITKLLYLPAALFFLVCWVRIAGARFVVPGQGAFPLFRTIVDTKRSVSLVTRLRPVALTLLFSIPGLLAAYAIYAGVDWLTSPWFPISDAHRELQASDEVWIAQMVRSAYAAELGLGAWAAYVAVLGLQALIVIVGYRLARRLTLRLSGQYWEKDAAPPILLLRSFSDDAARVTGSSLFRRLTFRKLRLEEVLARELARRGTVVAIGQPGERLPKLGAHRLYFDDDQWQDAVLAYIEKSAYVVVIGGLTPWVLWELKQIIEFKHNTKLIFVLPPGDREARTARLELLCEALQAEPAQRDDLLSKADRIITVSVLQDGRLHACLGTGQKQNEFELAAYFAMLSKGVVHG